MPGAILLSLAIGAAGAPPAPPAAAPIASTPIAADPPDAASSSRRTGWQGVLAMAEGLSERGRLAEALTLLDAMAEEDRRRPEIVFARAVLLCDLGHADKAEPLLARLIDDHPNVTRIRLEHGRALAAIGHYGAAERELRRALADDPPPAVVASIDTALRGIRANRRLFGSLSAGMAPDSNINQATSAEQIEMFGLPFEIDPSARRRSGIGFLTNGEIGLRRPLSGAIALVGRINGSARLYRGEAADDIAVEGRLGIERLGTSGRITPEVTYLKRWYAGQAYAQGGGIGLRIERRLSRRFFGSAILDMRHIDYRRVDAFDGWTGSLRLQGDRPLSAATQLSLGLSATRTGARDKGYAYWLGEVDASLYRDWKGGWSTAITASAGRMVADRRLAAFARKRDDWRWRASASIANRRLSWAGMMPSFRLSRDRQLSAVDLYDLDRTRAEILLTRSF